jgi:hypothetical protein
MNTCRARSLTERVQEELFGGFERELTTPKTLLITWLQNQSCRGVK